jgi:hypothetical protein
LFWPKEKAKTLEQFEKKMFYLPSIKAAVG